MLIPPSALKRSLFITGILMFTCLVRPVFAEWELQESGATEYMIDIFFIDENHGWAVGYNSSIIRTTDGGKHWKRVDYPIAGYVFEVVEFIDTRTGYCIGYIRDEDNHVQRIPVVLFTSDGGESWKDITPTHETIDSIKNISVIDKDTCWITVHDDLRGRIFHTHDGGTTWETQYVVTSEYQYLFDGIDFVDDRTGYALGGIYSDPYDHTYLYKTGDAGENWELIGLASRMRQRKIKALNEQLLWTCNALIQKSTDGGNTWLYRDRRYQGSIRDMYPIDDQKLFLAKNYSILYSDNGAESFETILSDSTSFFVSMSGIDGKYVWCIKFDGTIYKFTVNETSVETHDDRPDVLSLINTPNPFNNSTSISFSLAEKETVTVTIYDICGRKVRTLHQGLCSPGIQSYIWDGKSDHNGEVSSGIYLCRVRSQNASVSRRMTFVK